MIKKIAGDTFENHIRDTMVAGAGLNRQETVEFVIERAPHAIGRLAELGVDADDLRARTAAELDDAAIPRPLDRLVLDVDGAHARQPWAVEALGDHAVDCLHVGSDQGVGSVLGG